MAKDPVRRGIQAIKYGFHLLFFVLSPTNIKNKINEIQQMTTIELIKSFFKLWFYLMFYTGYSGFYIMRFVNFIKTLITQLLNIMCTCSKQFEFSTDFNLNNKLIHTRFVSTIVTTVTVDRQKIYKLIYFIFKNRLTKSQLTYYHSLYTEIMYYFLLLKTILQIKYCNMCTHIM